VQVYTGEHDYQTNWYGQMAWLAALEWDGQDDFLSGDYKDFSDATGNRVGFIRTTENLSFIKVNNSGQQVAADTPQAALLVLESLIAAPVAPKAVV